MNLMKIIRERFRINEPFTIENLRDAKVEYDNLRQMLKRLCDKGSLVRYSQGVYYIPKQTLLGVSRISVSEVIKLKYLEENGEIIGLYGGLNLENTLGLTTQVPNVYEIVTNKEKSRKRVVKLGNIKVILKKARVDINRNNVAAVRLLEVLTNRDPSTYPTDGMNILLDYIYNNGITKSEICQLLSYYPAKTSKRLIESGLLDEAA